MHGHGYVNGSRPDTEAFILIGPYTNYSFCHVEIYAVSCELTDGCPSLASLLVPLLVARTEIFTKSFTIISILAATLAPRCDRLLAPVAQVFHKACMYPFTIYVYE